MKTVSTTDISMQRRSYKSIDYRNTDENCRDDKAGLYSDNY